MASPFECGDERSERTAFIYKNKGTHYLRTDFVYLDGDELKLTNAANWGGVGTTNLVTLQASTGLGTNELVVAVRVVQSTSRATVLIFR